MIWQQQKKSSGILSVCQSCTPAGATVFLTDNMQQAGCEVFLTNIMQKHSHPDHTWHPGQIEENINRFNWHSVFMTLIYSCASQWLCSRVCACLRMKMSARVMTMVEGVGNPTGSLHRGGETLNSCCHAEYYVSVKLRLWWWWWWWSNHH